MEETQNRPGYYAVIPADVRYDDRLPPNAKLLYGEISALIGKDGYCYATNQYFAEIYSCTVKSISRLISALEELNYIVTEIERDQFGKVKRRRVYLRVSVPEIHPVDKIVPSTGQNCPIGIDKIVQYTNTSNTNIKDAPEKKRKPSLSDEQQHELFVSWITEQGRFWPASSKNSLYAALCGFYAPRETKRQTPSRTKAGFTALSNRLVRFSEGDPAVMVDLLERATSAGWKSVFPAGGDRGKQGSQPEKKEEWL